MNLNEGIRQKPDQVLHLIEVICVSVVFCLVLNGCTSPPSADIQSSARAAVSWSKPSTARLQRIKVERVSLTDKQFSELVTLPRTTSEFGSRWFVEQQPDTMHPGPWTTRLCIFDAAATRQCIRVELNDHASYGVSHAWLNEKLLFVRVWWGRIVSTDLVLDTETLKFVHAEDASYFKLVYSEEESGRE